MRFLSMLFMVFLLACQQKKNDSDEIEYIINHTMANLNKRGSYVVEKKENSLAISFTFGENAFLDRNSNLVLFSYLIHELQESIRDVDTLVIQYDFENLVAEKENFVYDKNNIRVLSEDLNGNPMYKVMLHYSLKSIDGHTLVQINTLIEKLNSTYFPNSFSFNGSFFELMRQYSMEPCETKSSTIIGDWNKLSKAIEYPEFNIKHVSEMDSITAIRNNFCKE